MSSKAPHAAGILEPLKMMKSFREKIFRYFTAQPRLRSAFLLSSQYVAGANVLLKEKKVKRHFILPLERGLLQPHFHSKNIMNREALKNKVGQAIQRLRLDDRRVILLLPELCQKVFLFSFEALPASSREAEAIIRFKIKKQMPLLPEDMRLSFVRIGSNHAAKVLATVARASVVREYEEFFQEFHLDVRQAAASSLSLFWMLPLEKEKDLMLLNVELDSFSLTAAVNSEIVLYRQKPLTLEVSNRKIFDEEIRGISQEIANTVRFIEDREKKHAASLWVRTGILDQKEEISSILKERLNLPVKAVESLPFLGLNSKERKILAPLAGVYL